MNEQNEQNGKDKEIKKDGQPKAKENKKSLLVHFRDYKGEFDKIIWPSPKDLIRQTIMVIVTSFIFGIIIFGMDSVYSFGYDLLVGLLG